MRWHVLGDAGAEPFSDRRRLLIPIGEGLDDGFDAVENRDRAAAALAIAVDISELRRQELVGVAADLV